jgi:hypothetical protein
LAKWREVERLFFALQTIRFVLYINSINPTLFSHAVFKVWPMRAALSEKNYDVRLMTFLLDLKNRS